MATPTTVTKTYVIPPINTATFSITVEGRSPLVLKAFSAVDLKKIEDKQTGKAEKPKEFRKPKEELEACFTRNSDGDPCIKAGAFKLAAVSACRYLNDIPMTVARGAFHVLGDLLVIKGSKPTMRTDAMPIGSNPKSGRVPKYRPQWEKWSVVIPIRYNASVITPEQVINLFNHAGFSVGVGEGRPEKNPALSWGLFEVVAKKGGK